MGWSARAHYPLALGLLAAAVGTTRPLRRVEVTGGSMRPTLEPGDRLLVVATRRARPGDLVTLADPRDGGRTVVKRVVAVSAAGLAVQGDNRAASTDSRAFGPVPFAAVRGRIVYRYLPEHRRGWLGRHAVPFEACGRTTSSASSPPTTSAT